MDVTESCVIYHHAHNKTTQDLNFNVTDVEGSLLFSYTDMLTLGLVLGSEKLNKKISSNVKSVTSEADRSDMYTSSKKT